MLHYGKQGKKQHGKSIRHSKRYLVGVCRVTGEVNVKPNARRLGKAKSNMSQLTQSLDYRWNEREWGWYKMWKRREKIKRKNELMIIEGSCDSKTFMVFAICLNKKTQNKTRDVRDDCDGNAVGWNERLCTWARKSLWGSPGLQRHNTDWCLHNYKSLLSSLLVFLLCINIGRDGTFIQTLTSSVASCFSLQDHQGCPHPSHPSESSLPQECQLEHNIETLFRDLT